ncbi:cysteine desulfurase [Candidatus Synechococcus calcipolaris G9]|uniref:Cysteine desulfurase n=1 Tax=Candidatus Synechococcus calcipolaris G9 TaxID=1497997 RepID=A0ABT6F2C4_9SYNE|nr:cysteine desulfurase family protein [Candidatus Synechococcus calcipolaris]MDG2991988.1 cysteine desulfurase [Candidatus Synechococcus calcipolaris G9]
MDYHATTPVDSRVADRIYQCMTEEFGNASSTDHEWGDRAEAAVKEAACQVADLVGASPRNVIFTSGATESLNLAIQGTVHHLERSSTKPRIAISTVEHKAVLDTCAALHKQGRIELIHISVDTQARLDLGQLEQTCARGIHLLCIMAANNEVGTIYPIEKIAEIAQSYQVPFLCDASQAVGKIPIQFSEWGLTMLALSAHKLYGPQGIGALVFCRDHPLEPLLYGGGQQKGLRPGTLNVPGIVGLGEACRLRAIEMSVDEVEIGKKRDRLQTLLQSQIPELVINGDRQNRLDGNLHISIPGIPNSTIIARVRHQLAISTGSACSAGVEAPSHVLRAMGLSEPVVEGALRISLGKFLTDNDIYQAAVILIQAVLALKHAMA